MDTGLVFVWCFMGNIIRYKIHRVNRLLQPVDTVVRHELVQTLQRVYRDRYKWVWPCGAHTHTNICIAFVFSVMQFTAIRQSLEY